MQAPLENEAYSEVGLSYSGEYLIVRFAGVFSETDEPLNATLSIPFEKNAQGNQNLLQNLSLADLADTTFYDDMVQVSTTSSLTISMSDQTVNDNGGGLATMLSAPTTTDVESGAVYSISYSTTNVAAGLFTVDSSTGIITFDGNLLGGTDVDITETATNPDGGTASVTFTVTIINNA